MRGGGGEEEEKEVEEVNGQKVCTRKSNSVDSASLLDHEKTKPKTKPFP